jgi:hypothetical protein
LLTEPQPAVVVLWPLLTPHSGLLCDTLSTSLALTDDPIVSLTESDLQYTGNALLLQAYRQPNSNFNLLMGVAGGVEIFKVSGTGEVTAMTC